MSFLLEQLDTFCYMLGFGLGMGFIYDLYQRFITRLKTRLWINIIDLLLGIATGMAGFFILLQANWGEFRFFVVFSIMAGFGLYFYLLKVTGLNR